MDIEKNSRVEDVMKTLSPIHQRLLRYRYYEELSYAEIALAMEMSEPDVKQALFRAREAMLTACLK